MGSCRAPPSPSTPAGIFLLGLAIGVVGMLFLPELTPRREQLNTEVKKQVSAVGGQVRDLGDQLKNIKTDDEGTKRASPSPSAPGKGSEGL